MKSRIVQPAPSFQPPETCTEHAECKAGQATTEDLKRNALDHYERISAAAHEWHSAIPKAIAAYFDKRLEAENAATSMRSACVEKVKVAVKNLPCTCVGERADHHARCPVIIGAQMITALESVSIQEREK